MSGAKGGDFLKTREFLSYNRTAKKALTVWLCRLILLAPLLLFLLLSLRKLFPPLIFLVGVVGVALGFLVGGCYAPAYYRAWHIRWQFPTVVLTRGVFFKHSIRFSTEQMVSARVWTTPLMRLVRMQWVSIGLPGCRITFPCAEPELLAFFTERAAGL